MLILRCDYEAPTALWIGSSALANLDGLGLPEELRRELLEWVSHFKSKFSPGGGWSSNEERVWHRTRAHELLCALRLAMPEEDVSLDTWAFEI
jgi:hypothetical protein